MAQGPEYEAAGASVGEALQVWCETSWASIDENCAAFRWPREGGPWVDLAKALERYADLARESGELPERMIIHLKEILDDTLPRDYLLAELRRVAISASIESYFNSGQRRSGDVVVADEV